MRKAWFSPGLPLLQPHASPLDHLCGYLKQGRRGPIPRLPLSGPDALSPRQYVDSGSQGQTVDTLGPELDMKIFHDTMHQSEQGAQVRTLWVLLHITPCQLLEIASWW